MQTVFLVGVLIVLVLGFGLEQVYAEKTTYWKSEFDVGILDSKSDSMVPLEITTISKNSLKLDWEKPIKSKNQLVIGYEIHRKQLDTNYSILTVILDYDTTSYTDTNLEKGFYGYKIIPIKQNYSEKITMHGIDRNHELFPTYVQGQQLLAIYSLQQTCMLCFDESFNEIDDIFQYEFPTNTKRQGQEYQQRLNSEKSRTDSFFDLTFDIKINH